MVNPNGAAEALLRDPLLNACFDQMEADAVSLAISAPLNDDETRRNAMLRVRAIRDLRRDLRLYAEGKAPAPGDTAQAV